MICEDAGKTSPTLLNRLCDWRDHDAWVDFATRYNPAIRSFLRRYRLDPESTEELCQRVWVELAGRMRTYHYDPGKTFRGWLRRLCQSRAIDLLRQRRADAVRSLEHLAAVSFIEEAPEALDSDADLASDRPALLLRAEKVQEAVRRRVNDRTWRVFWSIAIKGQSVREVAECAGISYYAAFAAQKRVGRMLREEGRRLMSPARLSRNRTDRPPTDPFEFLRDLTMSRCPSPTTLGRLAEASSCDSSFLEVEAHVETCPIARECWSGWPTIHRDSRIAGPPSHRSRSESRPSPAS